MSVELTSSPRAPTRWLLRHSAIAVALVVFADWLLYQDAHSGLSLAIFLAACGLVTIAVNPVRARGSLRLGAIIAFGLGVLAIVEDLSWLSFFIALSATLFLAVAMISNRDDAWVHHFRRALAIPFVGSFWLVGDVNRARKLASHRPTASWRVASLVAWIVPIVLFFVFVSLFASANPVIDEWVRLFDPRGLLAYISMGRTAFWLIIVCFIWPFVHMRRVRTRPNGIPVDKPAHSRGLDILFSKAAVLRSLVLFNALFAVQTSLDTAYLWGGLSLPAGLTYAAYAHRGAYPLIATALLAAAFVLIAMRPDGPAGASRWIKPLVFIWIAQNLMLVLSSLFRTSLYIAVYSLSELRLAAMIWMGLVATGLVLIVWQIVGGKSNKWLLDANAIAAAATLYACCFINFPYIVARYNVTHSLEATGTGPALDMDYLAALGPQAMPAFDMYIHDHAQRAGSPFSPNRWFWVRSDAQKWSSLMTWRGWSFRRWRLKQYLDTRSTSAVSRPDATPNNQ